MQVSSDITLRTVRRLLPGSKLGEFLWKAHLVHIKSDNSKAVMTYDVSIISTSSADESL